MRHITKIRFEDNRGQCYVCEFGGEGHLWPLEDGVRQEFSVEFRSGDGGRCNRWAQITFEPTNKATDGRYLHPNTGWEPMPEVVAASVAATKKLVSDAALEARRSDANFFKWLCLYHTESFSPEEQALLFGLYARFMLKYEIDISLANSNTIVAITEEMIAEFSKAKNEKEEIPIWRRIGKHLHTLYTEKRLEWKAP